MKKLIKIIFLLLLIQFVATDCGNDCTGEPPEGFICKQDPENGECDEIETCKSKKNPSDIHCIELPVYDDNNVEDKNSVCVLNSDGNACEGKPICPITVEEGKDLTDAECNQYVVSKDNIKTHKCVKDPEKNACIENILCGSVKNPTESTEEIDCKTYPVTDSENYECVKNSEGEFACKEEAKSTNAQTTIVKLTQTLSEIATTVPKAIETTSLTKNQTLSEVVSTIISTETTSITSTNQTKIPSSTNTDTETSIVFLGCSKFIMAPSYFTFTIHFIPLSNSLFSDTLTFILNIIYNTYLRRLENANAVCNKGESNSQMVNYDCRVEADTANIKQIKFEHEFTFSQGKVKIAGTSPLAKMSMNNLEKMDDKYSSLLSSNPSIYILDNSSFYRYDNYKFNISGTISGEEKPSSISLNKDLSLMMNIENSENEEEITKEADCTVTNINNDKYTLDCTAKDKNTYNLQSAMSIIDDKDILLVNINKNGNNDDNGTILDPYIEDDVQNVKYHYKKSGGIGAGAIVGIVLACVAALAAVITAILCLKKSPNSTTNIDSDKVNIRNINMN